MKVLFTITVCLAGQVSAGRLGRSNALPACKDAHYADTKAKKCWNLKDKKDGALVKDSTCYERKTDWIAYAGGGCYGKKEECDCNT
jgi:hypothetical protein